MASNALRLAPLPANTARQAFSLALAHVLESEALVRLMPLPSSIADEIAAGEKVERARRAFAETAAPDHAALCLKLRLVLTPAGLSRSLVDCLIADARRLGSMTGGQA